MAEPTPPTSRREELDGLRFVAVYLVVLYHAGVPFFEGGFIGVDLFFVLSGYLVTALLLRDLEADRPNRLRTFYSRRVRRLLPAALVTLLATALIYPTYASGPDQLEALDAIQAASLYVANWFFIAESSDYFSADVTTNPVLHFWSLAIEEQFYLVWPVVLLVLWRVAGRLRLDRLTVLRFTLVGLGIGLAAYAVVIGGDDVNRAYYGTGTRMYQLVAGAIVAVIPQTARVRNERAANALTLVGILALGIGSTSLLSVGPIDRGLVATAASLVLLIGLERVRSSGVGGLLAARPVAYLGRISYGTYLWHWIVILTIVHDRSVDPWLVFGFAALVASTLAALSHHIIETPIRRSTALDKRPGPVVLVGLLLSVGLAFVAAPALLDPDGAVAAPASTDDDIDVATLDWRTARDDIPEFPTCIDEDAAACILTTGTGPTLLLMGDSHAAQLIDMFREIARDEDLTLAVAVAPGCPWQRELLYPAPLFVERCEREHERWYDTLVPALDPDIIVLATLGIDDPTRPLPAIAHRGEALFFGEPGFDAAISTATRSAVGALDRPGRRIVLIEPVPSPPESFDAGACLSTATSLDDCVFTIGLGDTPYEMVLHDLAADEDRSVVDLDLAVCPRSPACDPVVGGLIVRGRADSHLTVSFARSLAPVVVDALQESGVL